MAQPETPKLDIKMLILPCVMMAGRYVDYKDPQMVEYLQYTFATAATVVLALYYFIYTQITSKNESKKIWVPPKAKPALPFGLGPPAEAITPKDYEETTYKDYEVKELKQAAQSVIMSVAITFFMSLKFGVHMSLLMQSIMTPFNAFELPLTKKYIFGVKQSASGDLLYNELFAEPTEASLALAERVKAAKEASADSSAGSGPIPVGEPRVEELSDKDDKDSTKDKSSKKDE